MRRNQRGVTFIGWVVLLIPVAILVYAVIRLTPVYLTYLSVSRTLTQVAGEIKGEAQLNPSTVRNAIDKRFTIEGVSRPEAKDIDIHREGDEWVAIADYEEVVPMLGNVSLLVQFHKQVTL